MQVFLVHKEKHEFALLSLIILLDTITMAVKLPLAVSLAEETKLKSKKQKKAKLVDWNQEASVAHRRGRVSARSLACLFARITSKYHQQPPHTARPASSRTPRQPVGD